MKKIFKDAFLTLLVMSFPAFGQSVGQYDLNWTTIDNGSGVSSGGEFCFVVRLALPS